ncbi:hypothetical protein HY468_05125 [Candidatus Roizmanbacteria bacterium]|nr:hypothetical protein [Candidatus Roizmanbacteria bacterium]
MTDTALLSLQQLPDQARQAWEETDQLDALKNYHHIENIVIAGMGGSAYSYYVVKSLFEHELKVPLYLSNDYRLPGFVGKKTFVVGSSYSGTTEETIACTKEAIKKGTLVTAVTAGGELSKILTEHKLPHYKFDPKHNPAGQPRMGQGYMIIGLLGILIKIGLIRRPDLNASLNTLSQHIPAIQQEAERLATKLRDRNVVFVAAEHLAGNAHVVRNQTNETAKQFADYHIVPEMNHHLLEGLKNPKDANLSFVFFNSTLYAPKNQKRMLLTEEVVSKNEREVSRYETKTGDKLAEVFELLLLGGYLTYHLAAFYGEDPNKIPWVDYFKSKLSS